MAPADGSEPGEWLLSNTLPTGDFDAVEKLRWDSRRWGNEVYHRVLQSGCPIADRQLRAADRLDAGLVIDLVAAWRSFHLTKLGRETPDVPCTMCFEEHEWQALVAYVTQRPNPPTTPPSLREAVRLVAGLEGFRGRKGDGEPATQPVWLGLQRQEAGGEREGEGGIWGEEVGNEEPWDGP